MKEGGDFFCSSIACLWLLLPSISDLNCFRCLLASFFFSHSRRSHDWKALQARRRIDRGQRRDEVRLVYAASIDLRCLLNVFLLLRDGLNYTRHRETKRARYSLVAFEWRKEGHPERCLSPLPDENMISHRKWRVLDFNSVREIKLWNRKGRFVRDDNTSKTLSVSASLPVKNVHSQARSDAIPACRHFRLKNKIFKPEVMRLRNVVTFGIKKLDFQTRSDVFPVRRRIQSQTKISKPEVTPFLNSLDA